MAYAKIENNIVVLKTYETDTTLTQIPDNVCCGMIQNDDGSFSDSPKMFDIEMAKLRFKRNNLLKATDWRAGSDLTLKEWANYRQSLRDITNGISNVSDIESITWPDEPT
tara:strand:+ start:201 stop:530 length:330 start_codon:yes stop_codon:yes gene_type:complete